MEEVGEMEGEKLYEKRERETMETMEKEKMMKKKRE